MAENPKGNPHSKRQESGRGSLTRLSAKHSGLDYVESVREVSFFQGKFLRLLFTGKLRTRNLFYLTLLFLGACLFPLGLLLGILTLQQPGPSAYWTGQFWLPLILGSLPMVAVGLACLAAFMNSAEDIRRARSSGHKGKR